MGSLTAKEIIDIIDEVTEHFTKDTIKGNACSEASAHGMEVLADTLKIIIPSRIYRKEEQK